METFRSLLTSSSNPMMTNSVTPMPNAPTASAYKARGMTILDEVSGRQMMRAGAIADKNVPAHDRRASNERIAVGGYGQSNGRNRGIFARCRGWQLRGRCEGVAPDTVGSESQRRSARIAPRRAAARAEYTIVGAHAGRREVSAPGPAHPDRSGRARALIHFRQERASRPAARQRVVALRSASAAARAA